MSVLYQSHARCLFLTRINLSSFNFSTMNISSLLHCVHNSSFFFYVDIFNLILLTSLFLVSQSHYLPLSLLIDLYSLKAQALCRRSSISVGKKKSISVELFRTPSGHAANPQTLSISSLLQWVCIWTLGRHSRLCSGHLRTLSTHSMDTSPEC